MLWYIMCPCCNGRGLVNTYWDVIWVLVSMGKVWSAQVETHFTSSLAWVVLRQHKLRHIFCPRRYRRVLIFTIGDAFCVPAGMELVWIPQVVIHFVSSLAWERFSQHMLRWNLHPCWHLSTHVVIHYVSVLKWEVFGQHILKCNMIPR